MTNDEKVTALSRQLIHAARAMGEPCRGAQTWRDLADETGISEVVARQVTARELERISEASRTFNVHVRKRWVLVAEYLSNGQQTARWYRDKETGRWHAAESWKRPKPWCLMEKDAAYIMRLLTDRLPADMPGRELVTY